MIPMKNKTSATSQKPNKRAYTHVEDKRKIELRLILVNAYSSITMLQNLYDLLKLDDHKRDENSYKVEMVRTAISQQRDNVYILERLYSVLGIQELKLVPDSDPTT